MYLISGLIREVISPEGEQFSDIFTISVYLISGLIREVISPEEEQFSDILPSQCI